MDDDGLDPAWVLPLTGAVFLALFVGGVFFGVPT